MTAGKKTPTLSHCPMCGGPWSEGFIDFTQLSELLPGAVKISDIDGVLEQHSTGRVLFSEFKPEDVAVSAAQWKLFDTLVAMGADVVAIWFGPRGDDRQFEYESWRTHERGRTNLAGLQRLYHDWWYRECRTNRSPNATTVGTTSTTASSTTAPLPATS